MATKEQYRGKDNCKCCDVPPGMCGKRKRVGPKTGRVRPDKRQVRSWRKDAYSPTRLNGGTWYSAYE